LPGDSAPEELLLAATNIAAAENLINGLNAAFDRAKVAGLGLQGSKWAKKVFPALAAEMSIEIEKLRDRLTLAWLGGNAVEAQQLVTRMKAAFG
jgi:NAD-dependent oxidoreductase involved in siderophore biosynthesis